MKSQSGISIIGKLGYLGICVITFLVIALPVWSETPFRRSSLQDSVTTRLIAPKGVADTIPVYRIPYEGDTIPWILMRSVEISRARVFSSPEAKARFLRLRYDVMKVLPYAQFAQDRYSALNDQLQITSKRKDQKKLIKACEKEIKDMFNREVKKLTVSQGKILLKLIDRQTGMTSYEVVKELKGGLNAFMFQSMAKVFGHNLKSEYDPRVDFEIENILKSLNSHHLYGNMFSPRP